MVKSIQVFNIIKSLKHLRSLKKGHKFIKRSKILLRFECIISWALKSYWASFQFELRDLQNLIRLMGHIIKMNCKNIFNTKKKDTCHTPFQSVNLSLLYLPFWLTAIYFIEMWSGLEAIWRTSKREGEGTVIPNSWLHPNTIFLQHFLTQQQYKN